MISLQVISKILDTKDMSFLELNNITKDYFVGYEEEFQYIHDHYIQYGNVPDKESFLSKFQEIELVQVTETDKYLLSTLQEEYMYYQSVPILKQAAKLLKTDAIEAAEYLVQEIKKIGVTNTTFTDITKTTDERFNNWKTYKDRKKDFCFTCGFQELDDLIQGISRKLELLVIFARTNQGKSWILEKMCTHVWQIGYNVGYVSPEMTVEGLSYRFDTLVSNISNNAMVWGKDLDEQAYRDHLDKVNQSKAKFVVATSADFNYRITVSKLRTFVQSNGLDLLAIDGITYLTDERQRKGDNKSITLTNIAEDLRLLSMELSVPILVVVQANRLGVMDNESDDVPELESIRDSDGIAHNATKVIAIRQKNSELLMKVQKNTFGIVGGKLVYSWDINTGVFKCIVQGDQNLSSTESRSITRRKNYSSNEEVF